MKHTYNLQTLCVCGLFFAWFGVPHLPFLYPQIYNHLIGPSLILVQNLPGVALPKTRKLSGDI